MEDFYSINSEFGFNHIDFGVHCGCAIEMSLRQLEIQARIPQEDSMETQM